MEVDIKPDGSERVKYNIAGLPLYVLRGILSTYPNYAAESHWHDDLEFIAVQSGKMQYNINGEIVNLHTGNGIFVNAKQFHFGFSDCHSECEFLCVLFHPALICLSQDMEKTFIAPIVGNTALSYCVLHGNIEWENRVLTILSELFTANDLKKVSLIYDLWDEFCRHKSVMMKTEANKNTKLNVLKEMIVFIQNNYKERICLADIAKAGTVGKTECCGIFQKFTNLTPILYFPATIENFSYSSLRCVSSCIAFAVAYSSIRISCQRLKS